MKKVSKRKALLILIAVVGFGLFWNHHHSNDLPFDVSKIGPTLKTEYKVKSDGWYCFSFSDAEEFINNLSSSSYSGSAYLIESGRCLFFPAYHGVGNIIEKLNHVSLIDTYQPADDGEDKQFQRCKIRVYFTDTETKEAWTKCNTLLKGDKEEEFIHIDDQGNLSGWSGATGTQDRARF